MSIIALGGVGLSSVELFEKGADTWTALPAMSSVRGWSPVVCVVRRSLLYAVGGDSGPHAFRTAEYLDLEKHGRAGNCMSSENSNGKPAASPWVQISPMSSARCGFSGVLLGDGTTLFVTGGSDGLKRLSTCEQLSTSTNTWSSVPSMPRNRCYHCTVLFKGKPVVIAGSEDGAYLATCFEYDPPTKRWFSFASLNQARASFGACVVEDSIYVAGGYKDDVISSVEAFDASRGTWTIVESALTIPRWRCATVCWGVNKLAVLGGDRDTTSGTVDVYDPVEKTWTSSLIPPMLMARKWFATVSY